MGARKLTGRSGELNSSPTLEIILKPLCTLKQEGHGLMFWENNIFQ